MKEHYPKIFSSFMIVLAMLLSSDILKSIGMAFFGHYKTIFLPFALLTISTILVFIVAYLLVKRHYESVFKGMFSKNLKFNFLYTIIPVIVGTMMLNAVINSFMPPQGSAYNSFMSNLASNKLYVVLFLIPIVFIAPVTEELVFRGMILRGLSGNYSAKTAILISATLFSLMHLNLAQIPNAFILGVIFAILMIHSRNILYVIIYHLLNNFLVTFLLFFIDPNDLKQSSTTATETIDLDARIMLTVLGFSLIYSGLLWTIKTITGKEKKVIPSDEVYDKYLSSFD